MTCEESAAVWRQSVERGLSGVKIDADAVGRRLGQS